MKKFLKSRIFTFILGIVIASSVGVFAYNYKSDDVTYTPSDSSWNVNNVKDAVDDLYDKSLSKSQNIWNVEMGYLYLSSSQVIDQIPLFKSINSINLRLTGTGQINVYGVADDINSTETLLQSNLSSDTTLSDLSKYSYLKLKYVSGSSIGVYWTYID